MTIHRPRSAFLSPLLATALLLVASGCPAPEPEPEPDEEQTPTPYAPGEIDDSQLKLDGIAPPPPLNISPERPLSGDAVTITIDLDGAVLFDLEADGPGCGDLADVDGTVPATLELLSGPSGACDIDVLLTMTDATTQGLAGAFHVQATDPVLPPVEVPDALLNGGALPRPSLDPDAPQLLSIDGPSIFINGSTLQFTPEYSSEAPIAAIAVSVDGFDGWWLLPVDEDWDGQLPLLFPKDIFDRLDEAKAEVTVNVTMLDSLSRFGNVLSLAINGMLVGTGDVQVGITWDTPTDVDLHVVEPGGEEIYYAHTTSVAGGQLDLDSNPACNIDGVNAENIYWPTGDSPVGEYTVRVRMYSDCGVGGASGTVTISHCGEDSPEVHAFTLGSTGTEATFTFDSSCSSRVSGRVRYEDFAVTDAGLAAAGRMRPVRFAQVQAVRASDDGVLAEGHTDAAGRYELTFNNAGEPGYYVRVLASSGKAWVRQSVEDLSGALYSWESAERFDESEQPIRENVDFDIDKGDQAGALNIFEVGVVGAAYARTWGGKAVPTLSWRWTEGSKPLGRNASFYRSGETRIYVLSGATDPDEYDDIVLAHEYGHFVMDRYSKSDSRGGSHSSRNRVDPQLAWGEGWASWFAMASLGVTKYLDTNAAGMGVSYSLETLPADRPLGNAGGVLHGNLSEAVVAAALLDLHDSSNESKDTISRGTGAIFAVMTRYLQPENDKFEDRGERGRDLVDLLDGWRCLGFGSEGANDSQGLRGNARGIHQLSYDFAAVDSCR
jgi:hypothetical protein